MTWTVTGTDVVDGPNPLPADFPDHPDVFAFGISDNGSYIVGRAQGNTDSDYTTWELYGAVRWTGGMSQFSSQLLDPFGEHTKAVASDVNNSGQAVGKSWGGGTPLVATVWDGDGTPTSLVSPWGRPSAARGINDQGHVVGASKDDGAKWRAILWLSGGGYCDLDPQGLGSVAEDITDVDGVGRVLVAGVTGLPDNAQPAVWQMEVTETPCVLDFWTMGSPPQATAYAVRRTVEGWEAVGYDDYGEGQRAFVWRFDGSGITEIQLAKAGRALGINSSGQIAGNYEAKKKEDHAMLWTPN
jgi:probable HAF family extracellular repeat protein